jgi:hypothetical protein
MSRTIRKIHGIKYRDGKMPIYNCKCEYCIPIPWRNRRQLTIKEDLSL